MNPPIGLVTIIVDRPTGSFHPEHSDLFYPINYGYIPGMIAPDGDEQDVYILGVDHPVEEFTGRIIAVIHRLNDVEDKWIAAPDGMTFTEDEINRATMFQEKFFISEIRIL